MWAWCWAATHVDIEIAEVGGVRAQAVGQRTPAFEHAQNVEHDEAETGMLGQFGGDAQGAVQGDGGVEQRGKFLGEKQDVAAPLAEGRQFELQDRFPGSHANVDRCQSLFAQFARNQLLIVARQTAGANFAIARHRAEKESGRHQNSCVTRMTSSTVVTPSSILRQPSSRRLRMPFLRAVRVSTPASAFFIISLRTSSLTSIISKMPIREL